MKEKMKREDICLEMVSIIELCSTICKYFITLKYKFLVENVMSKNSFPKFDDYGKWITYFFPITCIP